MSLNRNQFRQTRLFAPLGMMKQPHQMTPLEFANSPRTMIHGSDLEDFEDIRAGAASRYAENDHDEHGFHMGSAASADDRMRHRSTSAVEGFYHPVQPVPGALDRSKPMVADQGNNWGPQHHGRLYRNKYEDRGSISAIVSSPMDVKHHADYVHDALDRGGIPSGQAEYFATQLDTEHSEHSPGIPRGMVEVHQDEDQTVLYDDPRPGRSRIEHREDLYDSPVSRVLGRRTDGEQLPMFTEASAYDAEGWPTHHVLIPHPAAVPPENRAAVDAADEERKAPWLRRIVAEGQR